MLNHGDIELVAGRGAWSPGGEALTLTDLDPESWRHVITAISNGTFHATPRKKLLVGAEICGGVNSSTSSDPPTGQLRGNLTIRMAFPGHFTAHLFVGELLESTSSQVVDVQLCPNEVVMIAPKHSPPFISEVPRSVFGADGVLSLPGDKSLKASLRKYFCLALSQRFSILESASTSSTRNFLSRVACTSKGS